MPRKLGSKNKVVRDACRRGHLRTPENTYFHRVTGHVVCRECDRIWANKNHKRPEYRDRAKRYMAKWRKQNAAHHKDVYTDHRRRKYAFVNAWKSERGCQVCRENDPCCLDLHHRDPSEKEVALAFVVTRWKHERILAELEKCDVLCANCHRKLHAGDRVNGELGEPSGGRVSLASPEGAL